MGMPELGLMLVLGAWSRPVNLKNQLTSVQALGDVRRAMVIQHVIRNTTTILVLVQMDFKLARLCVMPIASAMVSRQIITTTVSFGLKVNSRWTRLTRVG